MNITLVRNVLSAGAMFLLLSLYTNCSSYQESTIDNGSADPCAGQTNCKESNDPYVNAPTNSISESLTAQSQSGNTPNALTLGGDCFLGPKGSSHRIQLKIYQNIGGAKRDIPPTMVTTKCEHGKYLAIMTVAWISAGSYGIRGDLFLAGATESASTFDRSFCYGTACSGN